MHVKPTDYAYAVGVIRAKEVQLLGQSGLERLVRADEAEFVTALHEAGYVGHTPSAMTAEETERTYRLMFELAPRPSDFTLFIVKRDYYNVKILIKSAYSGESHTSLLQSGGRIMPEKLQAVLLNRRLNELPAVMRQAVCAAEDVLAKTGNPQAADLILDKAAYTEIQQLAAETESTFVIGLAERMTDLANLRILQRVHSMGKDSGFLRRALLSGGALRQSQLLSAFEQPFAEYLAATPYRQLVPYAAQAAAFERAAERYILSYCRKVRHRPFGIEPLIAYLLEKLHEIAQVRLIAVCKANALPQQQIMERLGEADA